MSVGLASDFQYPSLDDLLEDPRFQLDLLEQERRRQEQNAFQNTQNRIARQNAEAQRAGLNLDLAQLQFGQQQGVSNLAQEILRQRIQELLAGQQGQRGISEMAARLLDTRFGIERQGLLDQLRLAQEQQNLNRLVETSQNRARRLIGG